MGWSPGAREVGTMSSMRHLQMALARLQALLEAMPKDLRRKEIEGLSKELRAELAAFMEAREQRSLCSTFRPPKVRLSHATGNIWSFKSTTRSFHRARCQIGGVLIRSGTVRRRDEAEDLLVHLRHAHALSGNLEERLLAATEALSALGKSVTFAVTLDARRWVAQQMCVPNRKTFTAIAAQSKDWQRLERPRQFQHRVRSAETVQRLARRGDAAETRKRLRQATAGRRLERSYLWAKKRAERLLERAMEPRREERGGRTRRGDRESHVRLRLELEQKDSDFL
eukprot:g15481.t1